MFLDEILRKKIEFVELQKRKEPIGELMKKIDELPPPRDFRKAFHSSKTTIKIIGEIKRASPSKGIIRRNFNPQHIARIYEKSGICAISVLTEEEYFKGSLEMLTLISNMVTVPVLRKDFIIDRYQIYQSRACKADAILLISSILKEEELKDFIDIANNIGIIPLIEVHTEEDLQKAINCGAEVIGINNRNLKTFEVDLSVTERLIRFIPDGKIVISESGIKSREDISRLRSLGVDGFLIGEAFMREEDIEKKVKEFLSGGFS